MLACIDQPTTRRNWDVPRAANPPVFRWEDGLQIDFITKSTAGLS